MTDKERGLAIVEAFRTSHFFERHYGTSEDETESILTSLTERIKDIEQEPKTGHCKDCKWWKDSDGVYRRGCHAESQCPINRREVYEGNGYCYMFEPQERSNEE